MSDVDDTKTTRMLRDGGEETTKGSVGDTTTASPLKDGGGGAAKESER